jgi:hypothetical protein
MVVMIVVLWKQGLRAVQDAVAVVPHTRQASENDETLSPRSIFFSGPSARVFRGPDEELGRPIS